MKTIKCLIIFSILSYSVLAQINDFSCPMPELQNKINMSVSYPLFGPTGTLKILVVYCKFSDDNFDQSPHTDFWPHTLNSMPTWGPLMLSQNIQSDYYDPSISGYFQDMSMNNFHIIGETIFYQPLHEQSYYWTSSGRHIGYLVEEILTGIDNNVDYSQFDQWDPYDFDNDGVRNEPDGKVDFIAICFRFANTIALDGIKYNGIAGLTGFHGRFGNGSNQLILDGKIISASLLKSGTFQVNVIDPNTGIDVVAHEIGHYLRTYSF
ncbi:MAG: immune inhibitor A [Ignavibacteriaceae bacterium]|jgi:M6 family metalloprotease-like protein|nr:immune inhibitor A [Ignavibacteriaceae bacterium]